MSDRHGFTRRQFIQTGMVMVSTVATVPTFLHRSASVLAAQRDERLQDQPGIPQDRILVVVQLSGGNDGLNTIIPYGDDEYYKARPTLAIARSDVLKSDPQRGVGLHPQMTDLQAMFDDARAAVVLGVGYPNPNRSHFASMDIWHTASPENGGKGYGWIGRTLDQWTKNAHGSLDPTACVCLGHEAPLAVAGKTAQAITFERGDTFRWAGGDLKPELQTAYNRVHDISAMAEIPALGAARPATVTGGEESQAQYVLRTAMDAQVVSAQVRKAVSQGPITSFPGGGLASQLKMVAAMIRAGLPTRVYYVAMGGFDTHANQANRQAPLLHQFTQGVKAFYDELKAMGQQDRVLTLAFSEFGRRVSQNASQGTDHGTAGPMFLFGPMVQPGFVGQYPSLDPRHLDEGDMVFGSDFRNVYAAALGSWLGADVADVMGRPFAPAPVLKARALQ